METFDPPFSPVASSAIWTEVFPVRSFETDASGLLSMQHLCNYLQEAAGNHADALGVSVEHLMQKNMTWMLSRLHVKVERYPGWKDTVYVDTWPSGHNGLFATREFRIYTKDGDQVARGTSAWLLIDLKRRRPMRIPAFIDEIPIPSEPRAIADPFLKLSPMEHATIHRHFEVRGSDLDLNKHANNVSFINWALESVPITIQQSHTLKGLEIFFQAQAYHGDGIAARARKDALEDNWVLHHALYNTAGEAEKEIATARTRWMSR